MAKVSGSNKKMMGSIRAKAGRVAKAGKRRPSHIRKEHAKGSKPEYVAGKASDVHMTTPEQRKKGRFLATIGAFNKVLDVSYELRSDI